jgi:hypothetical protein
MFRRMTHVADVSFEDPLGQEIKGGDWNSSAMSITARLCGRRTLTRSFCECASAVSTRDGGFWMPYAPLR